MKRLFFFITALSALSVCVNGQNTLPYWSLAGNSNATSSSKLGTTNTVNLRFFTKNLERMRVDTIGRVGIGTTSPDSRLVINSAAGQNSFRAQVNGSTKLLVDDLGGVSVGSSTTPPANGLYVSGNVGIGTATPTAKLHVKSNSAASNPQVLLSETENDYARLNFQNTATSNIFSIAALPAAANADARLNFYYGGRGDIMTVNGDGKVGIGTTSPANTLHIKQSAANRAIKWEHESQADNWNLGIGTFTLNCRFEFNDVAKAQISSVDGSFIPVSDLRLKEDIEPLPQLMDKIMQLKPSSYFFKTSHNIAKNKSIGFIAQDVEKIFPEIVYDFDGGYKGLNYSAFAVVAVKAIQEQQQKIRQQEEKSQQQEEKINKLAERLAKLEAALQLSSNNNIQNGSANVKLYNSPNPFKQSTTIKYTLPQGTKGQINIFNEAGSLIKTITANESGQTLLSSNGLPAGTYTYTLMINGKAATSKQMLLLK